MIRNLLHRLQKNMANRPEFDPTRFADPVANITAWTPAKGGGANFCTHKLIRINMNRLEFRASLGNKLFSSLFVLFGLGVPFFVIVLRPNQQPLLSLDTIIPILMALIFAAIGIGLLYFGSMPTVFDNQMGCFWKGWNMPDAASRNAASKKYAQLSDIHALQIIPEYCSGSSDGSPYYSFELNLVFRNGQRINIVDHGKLDKLRDDVATLSAFLGKPVWDATL